MVNDALYLVIDMINDLVHEDGANGKKGYGPELARRNTIANTIAALGKARAVNVRIGFVRIGFSPDYREFPHNSRVFQSAKNSGMFKLGTWGTAVIISTGCFCRACRPAARCCRQPKTAMIAITMFSSSRIAAVRCRRYSTRR
jgi:hypothetical protein